MKNKLLKIFITLFSIFLISNTVYAEDNEDGLPTPSGDRIITVDMFDKYYIGMYKDQYKINPSDPSYHNINQYQYSYKYNDINTEGKKETIEIKGSAYCIQGGLSNPKKKDEYSLNTEVNINLCTDIKSGASEDGYDLYGACGMAELLYQISNKSSDLYSFLGGEKYFKILNPSDDDSDNNSYAIITTALRLWINYYNSEINTTSKKLSSDSIGYTKGSIGNTSVTTETYKLNYNEGILLDALPSCSNITSGLCYGNPGDTNLYNDKTGNNKEASQYSPQLAYSLFYYLYINKEKHVSFRSNTTISNSNEFTSTSSGIYNETNKTYTMMVKDNEIDEKKVYELLASCAETEKGCSSIMTLKDQYGNEIGSCEKTSGNNICYNIKAPSTGKDSAPISIEIVNVKKCNIVLKNKEVEITAKTNSTTTTNLNIGKWWFGIITHASADTSKQALVAFNKDQINLSDPIPTTTVDSLTLDFSFININCDTTPCDPNHSCSTLEPTTDIPIDSKDSNILKETCKASATSDIGFEVKSIEDPSMSCIINNCEDTNEYEVPISATTDDIIMELNYILIKNI